MRIEGVLSDARRQGLSQELIVVLVLLLDFPLPALPHPVTNVTLEAEAQGHHWVTNTAKRKRSCERFI
jgi:hypothetical protein